MVLSEGGVNLILPNVTTCDIGKACRREVPNRLLNGWVQITTGNGGGCGHTSPQSSVGICWRRSKYLLLLKRQGVRHTPLRAKSSSAETRMLVADAAGCAAADGSFGLSACIMQMSHHLLWLNRELRGRVEMGEGEEGGRGRGRVRARARGREGK